MNLAQSPNAVQQADIIAHATVALDGREDAVEWLQTPNPSLSNRTPLDVVCLGTPEDLRLLDGMLSALEFGFYV